jgi:hypothetical protein
MWVGVFWKLVEGKQDNKGQRFCKGVDSALEYKWQLHDKVSIGAAMSSSLSWEGSGSSCYHLAKDNPLELGQPALPMARLGG